MPVKIKINKMSIIRDQSASSLSQVPSDPGTASDPTGGGIFDILTAPLKIIGGIGQGIAGLFGGGLTQKELDMVEEIHRRVKKRNGK